MKRVRALRAETAFRFGNDGRLRRKVRMMGLGRGREDKRVPFVFESIAPKTPCGAVSSARPKLG